MRLAPRSLLDNLVVPAVCAAGAVTAVVLFRELRHDDAFITFRYARNLATGAGFVFNPGERVLGTTSPLLTLLLAAVYAIAGDVLERAALVIGAVALGAQALALHRLLREHLPHTALLVCLAVLAGLGGSHTWLALESNLALALSLSCLWAHRRGSPRLAGLLLGLAFLTRHDAALIALLLPLVDAAHPPDARPDLRARITALLPVAAVAAAVTLPWLLFAQLHFGAPLPNTLSAKTGISAPGAYLESYAGYFIAVEPLGRLPAAARQPLFWCACALGALGSLRGGDRITLALTLQALALWLVYARIGPPASQHWHMLPATTLLRVAALVGVVGSLELLLRRYRAGVGALVVAALAVAYLMVLTPALQKRASTVGTEFWLGERHRRYTIVAHWVNAHTHADITFMPNEVGTLGYLSDRRMLDPFGLLSPTNDYPKTMRLTALFELFERHDPDLILLGSPGQAHALKRYAPHRGYRIIKIFPWLRTWSTLVIPGPRQSQILRQ